MGRPRCWLRGGAIVRFISFSSSTSICARRAGPEASASGRQEEETPASSALHHIYDPTDFAERLFGSVKKSRKRPSPPKPPAVVDHRKHCASRPRYRWCRPHQPPTKYRTYATPPLMVPEMSISLPSSVTTRHLYRFTLFLLLAKIRNLQIKF